MKIFTFGDGYATGHIWPEWPQILQALLNDHEVINTAGIGAGTEFLVTNFVDLMPQIQNSVVIFQWPSVLRYDKLIQDHSWNSTIDSDDVYSFNTVTDHQRRTWWLSSASKSSAVLHYHEFYIQPHQHKTRSDVWKTLVYHACASLQCQYICASTQQQEIYSRKPMFLNLRQNEVQPAPWIHFCWLKEIILPQLNISVNVARQQVLEKKLLSYSWQPYDPDREEIWKNIVDTLNG